MRTFIGNWTLRITAGIFLLAMASEGGATAPGMERTMTLPLVDSRAAEVASWSLRVMQPGHGQLQDLTVEGTGELADGTPTTMRFWAQGRSRTRAEMTVDSRHQFVSVSGEKGFRLKDGLRQELPLWVTLYGRPDFVPVFSRLREWNDEGANLEYLGEEEVDGRVAYRIHLWASPVDGRPADLEKWISEYEVFVDAETGLVVKSIGYIFSPEIAENRSPVETYYGDWRVDGTILAPHRVERWVSGQPDSVWVFKRVRVNSGVSASLFQ